jgi:hypothetical protein
MGTSIIKGNPYSKMELFSMADDRLVCTLGTRRLSSRTATNCLFTRNDDIYMNVHFTLCWWIFLELFIVNWELKVNELCVLWMLIRVCFDVLANKFTLLGQP